MGSADHPSDWPFTRDLILSRAKNKCELCQAENGKEIFRMKEEPGIYITHSESYLRAAAQLGQFHGPIKVVLAVHFIDGNKRNRDWNNLIALCQRCFLRLNLATNVKKRKITLAKEKNNVSE